MMVDANQKYPLLACTCLRRPANPARENKTHLFASEFMAGFIFIKNQNVSWPIPNQNIRSLKVYDPYCYVYKYWIQIIHKG